MTKTDNEKYVKRGADMFIEYNPEWEDDVSHANRGKVGAPYRYSETLIMLAAALRVGLGIQYRQLEGTVGKMIGESKTPSFSQLRKRMGRLGVGTHRDGMMTVSDSKRSRGRACKCESGYVARVPQSLRPLSRASGSCPSRSRRKTLCSRCTARCPPEPTLAEGVVVHLKVPGISARAYLI